MAKETLRSLLQPYGVDTLSAWRRSIPPEYKAKKRHTFTVWCFFSYAQQLNGGRPRAGESVGALRPQTPEAGEGFPCTPIPR